MPVFRRGAMGMGYRPPSLQEQLVQAGYGGSQPGVNQFLGQPQAPVQRVPGATVPPPRDAQGNVIQNQNTYDPWAASPSYMGANPNQLTFQGGSTYERIGRGWDNMGPQQGTAQPYGGSGMGGGMGALPMGSRMPFGQQAFGTGFGGRGLAYSGFSNPAGRSRYDRRR